MRSSFNFIRPRQPSSLARCVGAFGALGFFQGERGLVPREAEGEFRACGGCAWSLGLGLGLVGGLAAGGGGGGGGDGVVGGERRVGF